MVTLKDVARTAGFSVTTVSRALNDHVDVAPESKASIRQAAIALDYHPNAAARSLQNQRANALGLVVTDMLHRTYDTFWLEFIGGVIAVCTRQGIDLSLASGGREQTAATCRRWAGSRKVDGVLVCDVQIRDPRIAFLLKRKIPFVAFGRTNDDADYPFIDVDGATGAVLAIEHLAQLGHRRIAFVGVDSGFGFSRMRLAGYRDGLERIGLPYDSDLVYEGVQETSVPSVTDTLFALKSPPTAIFATADFLALALLQEARKAGKHVPTDLSLVVFDDTLPTRHADPPLTAISQPNRQLGQQAAEMLLDRIASPERPVAQRVIMPTLIERSSTAPILSPVPADLNSRIGDGMSRNV